jgi:hypothetical protein
MNWCKKHLNWTLVIAFNLISIITMLILSIELTIMTSMGFSFSTDGRWLVFTILLMEVVFWSLVLLIQGWVLKKKNRSLWWLFVLFIPPGWGYFGLIFLKNKSQLPDQPAVPSIQDQVEIKIIPKRPLSRRLKRYRRTSDSINPG